MVVQTEGEIEPQQHCVPARGVAALTGQSSSDGIKVLKTRSSARVGVVLSSSAVLGIQRQVTQRGNSFILPEFRGCPEEQGTFPSLSGKSAD